MVSIDLLAETIACLYPMTTVLAIRNQSSWRRRLSRTGSESLLMRLLLTSRSVQPSGVPANYKDAPHLANVEMQSLADASRRHAFVQLMNRLFPQHFFFPFLTTLGSSATLVLYFLFVCLDSSSLILISPVRFLVWTPNWRLSSVRLELPFKYG